MINHFALFLFPSPFRECLMGFQVEGLEQEEKINFDSSKARQTAARLSLVVLTLLVYMLTETDLATNPAPLLACSLASLPAAIITGGALVIGKACLARIVGSIASRSLQELVMGIAGVFIGWYVLHKHAWEPFQVGYFETQLREQEDAFANNFA